jgi:NhaP-type Na+/H+ or K+/H+ antiporter
MEGYFLILTIIGAAALGMAWMPAITDKIQISYSVIYVLFGIIIFSLIPGVPESNPVLDNSISLHLTEIVVIISLMGTGLKIDERFSFRAWKIPFRLVTVTMLLSIAGLALIARHFLNFDWPSAILLAAALAPTDPVLASDVQVGPPLEKEQNTVRFALTAEAGLNDGMAFPFTWLAILLVNNEADVGSWISWFLVYKILAGVAMGFLIGRFIAFLLFHVPTKLNFLITRDGFVALSTTLLVYGLTEMVKGYGFIAVFVAAVTLRNYEIDHKYHLKLHSFIDEMERTLLAIVLILFGGALVHGVLDHLTWKLAGVGLFFLFVIRPATAFITLSGTDLHLKEKAAISFFGIRGMGSFFYLAFAISQTKGFRVYDLWALVSFIVLMSVVIHGFTAGSIMTKLSKQFNSKSDIAANMKGLPGDTDPAAAPPGVE